MRLLPLLGLAVMVAAEAGCDHRQSIWTDLGPTDLSAGDTPSKKETSLDAPSPDLPGGDGTKGCQHPAVVKKCSGGWCTIPAGCFIMGSPPSEPCRKSNETEHPVTLTRSFQIMSNEVTQEQFTKVMAYNPSYFVACGKTCPADYLSWHMAAAYCNALSAQKGLSQCYSCAGAKTKVSCQVGHAYLGKGIYGCPGFRLPTEAEWEYSLRAGSRTPFYNGKISVCVGKDPTLDKIAWYGSNAGHMPHPVAQKTPNRWGLYDMAGNVSEFVQDWYHGDPGSAAVTDPNEGKTGTQRIFRGGDCSRSPAFTRAAFRLYGTPGTRYSYLGVRCVRSL